MRERADPTKLDLNFTGKIEVFIEDNSAFFERDDAKIVEEYLPLIRKLAEKAFAEVGK